MKKILVLALCIISVFSCRKDDIVDTPYIENPIIESIYVKKLNLVVNTIDDDPVIGAKVQVGNVTALTNDDGVAFIDGQVGNINGQFIKITHPDYYYSGRRLYAGDIKEELAKVTLIKKEIIKQISATDGGDVILSNGSSIKFAPNSFVLNGGDYNGDVNVYAYYLDPTDDDYLDRCPGGLSALNQAGDQGILTSYGMLAVELRNAQGQTIHIKANENATIEMKIPSDKLSTAPDEIPLWHFDEEKNIWKEEGKAIKNGSVYVGKVSHFSWWNCDDFSLSANLCVQFVSPLRNTFYDLVKVELYTSLTGSSVAYTNEEGRICGIVPAGQEITLRVYSFCNALLYEEVIGPFAAGTFEEVLIPFNIPDDVFEADFEGTITNCQTANPVINGYVALNIPNNEKVYKRLDNQGAYQLSQLVCEDPFEYVLQAVDQTAGLGGITSATGMTNNTNLLDLEVCEELEHVIIYDPQGQVLFNATDPNIFVRPRENMIQAKENGFDILIGFEALGIGSYPCNVIIMNNLFTLKSEVTNVNITSWGPVGSLIKGTISGEENGEIYTGSFAVYRD